ncbi:DUF4349 domain-containing protein [Candidatus Micrarchaeota archaeon]|nr:DUF4349 domain-containing protein [Candidatus Micrarchaeota archaeon]
MKAKVAMLAFVALFMFFGCIGMDEVTGDYPDSGSGYSTKAMPAPMVAEEAYYGGSNSYDYEGEMVVKEGHISIGVDSGTLEQKKEELNSIIDDYNAEASYVVFNEYETEKQYAVTVKMDPDDFDAFLESVYSLGKVSSIDTSLEDVTEEYTDIQTRIENLEEELARLNALYNEAEDVEEILMIEREVTRVQTELELYQGRALELERRSAESTVTVYLVEEKPAIETDLFMPLEEILNLFLGSLSFAIMLMVGLAGFLIPIALVFFGLRAAYRALKKKI